MRRFKHNKTGKLYALVSNNFMIKNMVFFTDEGEPVLDWNRGLILYKALYNNPDGQYFGRTADDFYSNFTEIIDEDAINRFHKWENDMLVSEDEWKIMSHNIEDYYDRVYSNKKSISKGTYLIIQKISTKLLGTDYESLKKFWITDYSKK